MTGGSLSAALSKAKRRDRLIASQLRCSTNDALATARARVVAANSIMALAVAEVASSTAPMPQGSALAAVTVMEAWNEAFLAALRGEVVQADMQPVRASLVHHCSRSDFGGVLAYWALDVLERIANDPSSTVSELVGAALPGLAAFVRWLDRSSDRVLN